MNSPRQDIESHVAAIGARLLGSQLLPGPYVKPAADPRHGDFQTNLAMSHAKALGRNPRELAQEIANALGETDVFFKPELAGPGFINFRLKPDYCSRQVAGRYRDPRLGIPPVDAPSTLLFDFSGPNIAKEMHVGHIRSTILGDTLARLYRFLGHRVITDNHLGDWGTQFGMVIVGYKRGGNEEALKNDPFGHLESLYKAVQEETKTKPETLEEARRELLKLQQGDPENNALWKKFIDLSLAAIDRIYQRLDVTFDHTLGESFYNDRLSGVVQELVKKGIARESEGAVAVFSDHTLPEKEDSLLVTEKGGAYRDNPFLIQKSDGAFLYGTTDLATVQYRVEHFRADTAVYVTDARQQMHFNQLFATVKRWGLPIRLEHVWFGAILGEDKKPLKTREGKPIKLKALLDEAEERALKIVAEKRPDFSPEKQKELARIVGLGALKYADLCQNRNLDYVFNWEKLLAFDGNTAPYLQYAYVRIRSIFRKGNVSVPEISTLLLSDDAEVGLAKKLLDFSDTVALAAAEYRPHYLCIYLFELATAFSKFFENCPVLKAEGETKNSRLVLCSLTASTLKQGLGLLGIEVVEEM
jgi:arginyl-tRNA synthetase